MNLEGFKGFGLVSRDLSGLVRFGHFRDLEGLGKIYWNWIFEVFDQGVGWIFSGFGRF